MSLPRNQKFVTRVNYKDSLATIFAMVCAEKNLDPYKYELRHPTRPDVPLNMATPLEHYAVHEICVVSVSGERGAAATANLRLAPDHVIATGVTRIEAAQAHVLVRF